MTLNSSTHQRTGSMNCTASAKTEDSSSTRPSRKNFAAFKAPAETKIYASPELLAGEPIDNRNDIWSLGVIIGEMHPYYRKVADRCLMRDRAKRFASAEEVKNAILHESSRKFWKAVLLVAVCGVLAALAAGVIIKGFEPQQNADQSGEVQSAVSGEVQMTVSSDTEAEVSGEAQAEVSEQEADQSVISGQEQGLPEASEQSYKESTRQSGTPEQGSHESAGQNIQAVERAMKTTVSQSSGQAAKDNWTRKDTTGITKGLNHEQEDPSATDQPSSETSAENIDTEALEDLFKEAAGQIL